MDVDKELARIGRRLKVSEAYIRRALQGTPGGSTRVTAFEEALSYADREPIRYEVGEPIFYKPWQKTGTIQEWSNANDYGTVLLETGEALQCEASEIEKFKVA